MPDLLPTTETFGVKPLTYNRFRGNPPAPQTADEAFEAEMGFPFDPRTKVESEIDDLMNRVLDLETKSSTPAPVQPVQEP